MYTRDCFDFFCIKFKKRMPKRCNGHRCNANSKSILSVILKCYIIHHTVWNKVSTVDLIWSSRINQQFKKKISVAFVNITLHPRVFSDIKEIDLQCRINKKIYIIPFSVWLQWIDFSIINCIKRWNSSDSYIGNTYMSHYMQYHRENY